jgi:hypothetical protein
MPKYKFVMCNSHNYSNDVEIEADTLVEACDKAMLLTWEEAPCEYPFESDCEPTGIHSIELDGEDVEIPAEYNDNN